MYVNSKFLYLEQSLKRTIDRTYAYTIHRRFLLWREILRNRLAPAPLTLNLISSIIKEKRGYLPRKDRQPNFLHVTSHQNLATIRRTDRMQLAHTTSILYQQPMDKLQSESRKRVHTNTSSQHWSQIDIHPYSEPGPKRPERHKTLCYSDMNENP